ncbi:hypothetical protein FB451DRAFT_1271615 [Mycena latifolia]|nr:hypothetical protein FB451DRAFT_1271615 [Mycena latifolia]
MSSSSVPSPTISATPSSSSTSSPTSGSGSNLYLFTFLATLTLLLAVSCSILSRAVIVRRRFRQRVDRAMAQGLILLPGEQGSRNLSFGAEPKLYDVWLSDSKTPLSSWRDITPIAAQPVPATDSDFSSYYGSVSSKAPSTLRSEAPPELLQVSVLVAMPHPPTSSTDELPEVALALTHSLYQS